ncbi:hypothetical protein ACFONG_01365 [Uliginosibacterium paludis]|uniref:Uncharacterized protein n=1 Tax=Uliginosibacterium paludis TaxID=1615952 RepID=A0ABV2CQN0_9RHOO
MKTRRPFAASWLPCMLLLALTACDRLGLPDPAREAAAREADGKAIGGACRHAGRALEDCYAMNPSAEKAAVFAGWKEMNDYMAENKIEVVKPEISGKPAAASAPESSEESASSTASSSRRKSRASANSGHE